MNRCCIILFMGLFLILGIGIGHDNTKYYPQLCNAIDGYVNGDYVNTNYCVDCQLDGCREYEIILFSSDNGDFEKGLTWIEVCNSLNEISDINTLADKQDEEIKEKRCVVKEHHYLNVTIYPKCDESCIIALKALDTNWSTMLSGCCGEVIREFEKITPKELLNIRSNPEFTFKHKYVVELNQTYNETKCDVNDVNVGLDEGGDNE